MAQTIITNPSFGQQNNTNFTSTSKILKSISPHSLHTTNNSQDQHDHRPPLVNMTYPTYPPTVTTGEIIIRGTARDSGSGIRNVSAAVHTFPFDDHFIKLSSQPIAVSSNNWSHWSAPLEINKTGTYRIVISALDNAGNRNYAETTINVPIHDRNNIQIHTMPKIAFVRPTFTEAAYQDYGFYRFYTKNDYLPYGKNITTDLDMLTVKIPRSVSEFKENNIRYLSNITSLIPINGTELHSFYETELNSFSRPQKFWMPFIEHVKKNVPHAIVTVMRDEDVHDDHIFYADNKTNAFDILLLFHNEYVTQKEYDNLRQFVKNGGTIVFIDANVFYAEVAYDKDHHTISLAKGHTWEFDGKVAIRSVTERWHNDTKEWVGGNYLLNYIKNNTTFANNPFNYSHFEEQMATNPKDKIIIDYGISFPSADYLKQPSLKQIRVATYTLDYGKGKVIMLGLYGQKLVKNQKFMNFFDNVILPEALCPKFQSCGITINYP